MRRIAMGLLMASALVAVAGAKDKAPKEPKPTPEPKEKITVVTTLDASLIAAVDHRQTIQDAVDNAVAGEKIELVGEFFLDGTPVFIDPSKGNLTIEGREVDDDGDGLANEDWADGVDNDGDTFIDEDDWNAVVVGVDNGSGGPALGNDFVYNRGFQVEGVIGNAAGIIFRGIKFTLHQRALSLDPTAHSTPGLPCDGPDPTYYTGGRVKDILVERNWFDNNQRGFQVYAGGTEGLVVRDNLITNSQQWGILILGGQNICFDSSGQSVNIGGDVVQTGIAERNVIADGNGFAVIGSVEFTVRDNLSENCGWGLYSNSNVDFLSTNNMVSNCYFGVDAAGTSSNAYFVDNAILGSIYLGFLFDEGANGNTATGNEVSGSGFFDYYLCGPTNDDPFALCNADTFNNTVDLLTGTEVVFDAGSGNTINAP